MNAEQERLQAFLTSKTPWRKWGPYLSERQWGTVREDYSDAGDAWNYFSHEQSHARAYRWGEDGLLGISDAKQRLCFSVALWNGEDPVLKERMFGLTGNQGNHGEDVKEYYFYLDSTPTHSYMKGLYKYPQAEFPYRWLVEENQRRGRHVAEFELLDTGVFNGNRYFDVEVEYAKADPKDILIRLSITNRGPETKVVKVLPHLWFRNTWSWGDDVEKPQLKQVRKQPKFSVIEAANSKYGTSWLYCDHIGETTESFELLFTENETNFEKLFGARNLTPYVKDGIHRYVVNGQADAVNPAQQGTKFAANYSLNIDPDQTHQIKLRLTHQAQLDAPFGPAFAQLFATRIQEADDFYQAVTPCALSEEMRNVQRQAFAGLLWTTSPISSSI